jgi:hypothetical protein
LNRGFSSAGFVAVTIGCTVFAQAGAGVEPLTALEKTAAVSRWEKKVGLRLRTSARIRLKQWLSGLLALAAAT